VLIEVPHQASLHNGEREVYVLRSDTGQTWHEHPSVSVNTDVNDALDGCFQGHCSLTTTISICFLTIQYCCGILFISKFFVQIMLIVLFSQCRHEAPTGRGCAPADEVGQN